MIAENWRNLNSQKKQKYKDDYEQLRSQSSNIKQTKTKINKVVDLNDGYEEFLKELQRDLNEITNDTHVNAQISAPKKPLNSYIRYYFDSKNDYLNKGYSEQQTQEAIVTAWENLSEKNKQQYNDSYQADFEEYTKIRELYEKYTQPIKKPISSFFIFQKKNIDSFRKKHPNVDQKELATIIGKEWNRLPEKQKREFQLEYQNEKEEYNRRTRGGTKKYYEASQKEITEYNQHKADYEKLIESELDQYKNNEGKRFQKHFDKVAKKKGARK